MTVTKASLLSEASDALSRLACLGWDLLTEQHRQTTTQHGQAEEVKSRNLPPAALQRNCSLVTPKQEFT